MVERSAIVVGGGIGGLATAAGLLRHGWSVLVLEQAPEFTEVGAGISLWPNAFRALESIGVTEPFQTGRIGVAGGLRDWRGHWIVRMDDLAQAAEYTSKAVVAHRAELLGALLSTVPDEHRRAGVRVRGVRRDGARAVVEVDEVDEVNGGGSSELTADVVVGADGLWSAVRGALWPEVSPRYSRRTAWRMVLPEPPEVAEVGAGAWAETWGPGGVFGMFPMPGDRVYCYATATVPAGGRASDGELTELRRRLRDWCPPIPAVVDAADPEYVLRNDIYYLPPLAGYVSGPVALVGDAAHAMTPNLGQGGCQALEDAATLAALLGAEPDIDVALRRYDLLRRPRTQQLARQSRLAGAVGQVRAAPVRVVRNAALRLMPRSMFLKSLARPFDWRPPPA